MKKIVEELAKIKNKRNASDLDFLSKKMQGKEMRDLIQKYLKKNKFVNEYFDDLNELKEIVYLAQYIYQNSGYNTGMTDSEYDILFEKLDMLSETVTMFTQWISNDEDTSIVHHKFRSLRGTLDKVYALTDEDILKNDSRKPLDKWIKSTEKRIYEKTGKKISIVNEEIYCFPKFDGVSVVFQFSKTGNLIKALTRGNTLTNEAKDVTHIFKGRIIGPFDHSDYEYGLKTEIMMTDDDLEEYNKTYGTKYKQSRSIVSSIINSKNCDERANYLKIIPLRVSYLLENGDESLQELAPGVYDYPYLQCKLNDREMMREFALNHKYVNGLRTDGMVIYLINKDLQKILGRENEKQKYEVAYKFTEEKSYGVIKDIEFSTGMYGIISPIAIIKPIKMKGNTISRISFDSFKRFKKFHLAKGDVIQVLYDIRPYLIFDEDDPNCKRSGKEPIPYPTRCPECHQPSLTLSESSNTLICSNPECPCKKKGKILNFCNKMNIENISYATIDTFYELGYLRSIKDLYKLKNKKKELYDIPGFGKRSIKIILDEIDAHRTVTESQLLGSLGILGISEKTFKQVLSMLSFDEVLDYCYNDKNIAINVLTIIPGIKEKKAEKIIDGIAKNEALIDFLEEELIVVKDRKASKFNVVFTKVRDADLEKFIEENGGATQSSVTKNTDMVIVPMKGVDSSKVSKANQYNIPVFELKDAKNYIEENFIK